MKSVSDIKIFWKMTEPYFFNKEFDSNEIFLSEKERLIKDPVAVATTMNDYFVNITQTIGLTQFQFDHANNLFEDHTSIIRIISNLDNFSDKFVFKKVHEKEVKREITNLNSKKQYATTLYQPNFLNSFATHIFP